MATDVNLIHMALEGKQDLLATIGLIKLAPKAGDRATGADWQMFKKRHNAIHAHRVRRERQGGRG